MLANSSLGQRVVGPARGVLQLVDNAIQAFTAIAHTVDTTFIATLTSINAIVSLIEQLKKLKQYLFGITATNKSNNNSNKSVRCVAFLTGIIVIPYLINKLISRITGYSLTKQKNDWINEFQSNEKQVGARSGKQFAVCMFSFNGERDGDLKVGKGDVVAILDESNSIDWNSSGSEAKWMNCKTEDGRYGLLPSNFLKPIKMD